MHLESKILGQNETALGSAFSQTLPTLPAISFRISNCPAVAENRHEAGCFPGSNLSMRWQDSLADH